MYTVMVTGRAAKQFDRLGPQGKAAIDRAFDNLATDPRGSDCRPLRGEWAAFWRVRSRAYRAIHEIDDDTRTVTVIWIGHRQDAPYG